MVEEDRGSLPFALIHGEALVTCAAWALGEAGVTPVDLGTSWEGVVASGEPFVVHDSLCPMTPAGFVAACVSRAVADDVPVVGVRPVTDTVKEVHGEVLGRTVDRTALWQVVSPVVLPARVVALLDGFPPTDLTALAGRLSALGPVVHLEAPPQARRVASEDDVRLLSALTRPDDGGERRGHG